MENEDLPLIESTEELRKLLTARGIESAFIGVFVNAWEEGEVESRRAADGEVIFFLPKAVKRIPHRHQ